MDALTTASFVLAIVCTVAAIAFTWQFAHGQWLLFLVGREVFDQNEAKQQKARKTGVRMAFVTGAFALLSLTILVYKFAEINANDMLRTAGLMANNVAFLLFIVALIVFYAMQRMDKSKEDKLAKVDASDTSSASVRMARRQQKARVDSFPTATLIFLIVVAVLAFGLGLLFSAI